MCVASNRICGEAVIFIVFLVIDFSLCKSSDLGVVYVLRYFVHVKPFRKDYNMCKVGMCMCSLMTTIEHSRQFFTSNVLHVDLSMHSHAA